MTFNIFKVMSTKKLLWILGLLAIMSSIAAGFQIHRIIQIQAFNNAILNAKSPRTDMQSFEAKFATAYWLAKNERLKNQLCFITIF